LRNTSQIDSEYNKTGRPFKHLCSTSRWKKSRKEFMKQHPLCVECKSKAVIKAASVEDHIEAHKGDEVLFWNQNNWQALYKKCHDRKTAKEDGRWGSRKSYIRV
jgi:5-methylcytosine-specific restriction enzyme A